MNWVEVQLIQESRLGSCNVYVFRDSDDKACVAIYVGSLIAWLSPYLAQNYSVPEEYIFAEPMFKLTDVKKIAKHRVRCRHILKYLPNVGTEYLKAQNSFMKHVEMVSSKDS